MQGPVARLVRLMQTSTLCLSVLAFGETATLTVAKPEDRPDRCITIAGERPIDLIAEYSTDTGKTWHAATIYAGTTVDEWRPADVATWNLNVVEGRLGAGTQPCLWNYFFDLPMPVDEVLLRFKAPESGEVVQETAVDLRGVRDVFVIDWRNIAGLAGGALPAPYQLTPGTSKTLATPSVEVVLTKETAKPDDRYPVYRIEEASAPPLVLKPGLEGWHRIYLGMERYGTVQFWLSGEDTKYPVPEYMSGHMRPRLMQDFYIKSADLTGQDICLACGGARYWQDLSVRYIRVVPMTEDEVARFHQVRERANAEGRPFAGYVEQCTPCHYEPASLTLEAHTRNEMRLCKARGCTAVYVHVIRAGSKAWYHSDVVERHLPMDEYGPDGPAAKWTAWMTQGDPLAVAIEEARGVGLMVFADMGMNVSYEGDLRERVIREHPDYLCGGKGIFLDYRKPEVRDYVVAIATELLIKYNIDGVHLDYARFGCNQAFDEAALVDVGRRIHEARHAAADKWGRPMLIAVRIPSYRYHQKNASVYRGEYPEFVAALETWAETGCIDRVMACAMGSVEHVKTLSVERYKAALAGTDVELWGDLYGGGAFLGTPQSAWLEVARKWVAEGLDGGFFFYTIDRPTEFEQINWQLRLIDFPRLTVGPGDR